MSDTTSTIRIVIVSSGTEETGKKVKDIGGGAKSSAKEVGDLKKALAFAGVAVGANEIVKTFFDMNDKLAVLNNRLLLFNNVQGGSAVALDNMQRIATITGASLNDVSSAYTRLTLASHDLGLSQAEVASLTSSLFKGFILLSGSADGAKDSIRVLDQALERGYVNVRELRSLAGQNPLILNALATALGHSSAELFKITAQGKLSGQELAGAFNSIAPIIEKSFAEATPTIKQEIEKITTSIEVGLNKIRGGRRSQFDLFLDDVNNTVRFITGQKDTESEKVIAAAQARDAAQAALQRRTSTPDSRSSLQNDYVSDLLEKQKKALAIAQVESEGTAAQAAGAKVIAGLTEKKIISEQEFNELLARGVSLYNINTKYGQQLDNTTYNQLVNQARNVELLKAEGTLSKQLGINQQDYVEKLLVADVLRDKFTGNLKAQLVIAEHLLQIEADRLKLSPDASSAAKRGGLLIDLQKQDNRGIADEMLRVYNNINGAARTYQQTLAAINQLEVENRITHKQALDELEKAQIVMLDTQKGMEAGFARGFLKLDQEIHDFASQSEKVVTDAFSGMEDALVDFTHSGTLNFSKMVNSILDDLTRLVFRQAVSGLLGGGGAGGGILSSLAGSFLGGSAGGLPVTNLAGALADGGPAQAGRPYLVGEEGPEIFRPNTSGTVVPNGMGMGGGVNVTVVNVTDPEDANRAFTDPNTDAAFMNKVSRNRSDLKRLLQ